MPEIPMPVVGTLGYVTAFGKMRIWGFSSQVAGALATLAVETSEGFDFL